MSGVYITLGDRKSFGINEKNHLLLVQEMGGLNHTLQVDLGLATKKRIEQLQEYLGRLKIHAIEEKIVG